MLESGQTDSTTQIPFDICSVSVVYVDVVVLPLEFEGTHRRTRATPPLVSMVSMFWLRLIEIPVPSFIRRSTPSILPSPSMSASAGGAVIYPIVSHI